MSTSEALTTAPGWHGSPTVYSLFAACSQALGVYTPEWRVCVLYMRVLLLHHERCRNGILKKKRRLWTPLEVREREGCRPIRYIGACVGVTALPISLIPLCSFSVLALPCLTSAPTHTPANDTRAMLNSQLHHSPTSYSV